MATKTPTKAKRATKAEQAANAEAKAEKILAIMDEELTKDPAAATADLFAKAKAIDPAVGRMSLRQFHARYPLQVKRRKSKGRSRGKARTAGARKPASQSKGSAGGEGMRAVFLRFAEDLTGAEDRRDLVKVLANVDRYVADALKVARK